MMEMPFLFNHWMFNFVLSGLDYTGQTWLKDVVLKKAGLERQTWLSRDDPNFFLLDSIQVNLGEDDYCEVDDFISRCKNDDSLAAEIKTHMADYAAEIVHRDTDMLAAYKERLNQARRFLKDRMPLPLPISADVFNELFPIYQKGTVEDNFFVNSAYRDATNEIPDFYYDMMKHDQVCREHALEEYKKKAENVCANRKGAQNFPTKSSWENFMKEVYAVCGFDRSQISRRAMSEHLIDVFQPDCYKPEPPCFKLYHYHVKTKTNGNRSASIQLESSLSRLSVYNACLKAARQEAKDWYDMQIVEVYVEEFGVWLRCISDRAALEELGYLRTSLRELLSCIEKETAEWEKRCQEDDPDLVDVSKTLFCKLPSVRKVMNNSLPDQRQLAANLKTYNEKICRPFHDRLVKILEKNIRKAFDHIGG